MDVEIGALSVERAHQQPLPLLSHPRRVMLPRRVNHARDEALERVAAHEQAEALTVGEVKDARGDTQQLVFGDLEQLVARIAVENADQLLFGVAAVRKTCPLDDIGGLSTQQGYVGGVG